jgi:hypothetical protein
MRYKYYFKNSVDVLVNNVLTKKKYSLFVEELKKINLKYGYQIYIAGDYVSYITSMVDEYDNYIDFFVMAEKIIDLDELTEFFKEFHELAKKYMFAYELMYFMNANSDDINTNPNAYYILNIEKTGVIKLYIKKESDSNTLESNGISGVLIPNSELFESVFSTSSFYKKHIDKIQSMRIFQKPLKIS